ncbi:MAG TPA: acetate uptake transporter [Candidatus Baltobacteraceae bacterium]|nr:acetate uptake transporter [Candidatus Baltobacteraceae bacterium]
MHRSVKQTLNEIWTKAGPVESPSLTAGELHSIEERHQVVIADPAPLGLFGFGLGTIVLGFVLSGIVSTPSFIGAVPAVLIFAGGAQFVAGLFALARGNTFAATAFGSNGANNALIAVFIWMKALGVIPAANSDNDLLLGVGLLCMGYISMVLGFAAIRINPTFLALVWALVPGYVLPGLQYMGLSPALGHAGGYFLFVAALIAFYAGTAIVINSTHQRNLITLGSFPRDVTSPKG